MTGDRLSTILGEGLRRIFSSYHVVLAPPEAATSDGPHTLQRILLITSHRAPLVLGWANPAQRRAQLHTLGHTLSLSKLRLGTELVMPPLEYARFLETATRLLEDEGMTVAIVAFVKERVDSGVSLRANAHTSSTALPYDLVDALTAASALASRLGAASTTPDQDRDARPAAAAASGWSKVLRWAPSGSGAAARAKRDSSR